MADDLDRLDQLLADQEKAIRDEFRAYLASIGSATVTAAVIERLEMRDIEGAMKIIDSYIARLGNVIPRVSAVVGTATAAELADLIADAAPDIVAGISFDPSHPRAADLVQQQRARFVREFTDEQRKATQQAISRSMTSGTDAISTARALRESIGLTSAQEQWVANYRKLLENRSRQALARDLRDRRFDGRVEQAIENNRPLTEKQIETMVSRYRKNALQMRGEMIARTEGLQATSEARDESLAQMIEQTGIEEARIEETWNSTRDKRTRDWHRSMNGQKVPYGGLFTDGLGNKLRRPGDPNAPANTRIGCRCAKTFSVRPAA